MADPGFGSAPWKNAQAVRFAKHGELEGPVSARAKDGIVIGVEANARAAAQSSRPKASPEGAAAKRAMPATTSRCGADSQAEDTPPSEHTSCCPVSRRNQAEIKARRAWLPWTDRGMSGWPQRTLICGICDAIPARRNLRLAW